MVGEMSSILRELETVQDRLSSLASDAGDEKIALLARREELRTRAARLADDVDTSGSTQELLTQLASLRRRRDVLNRQIRSSGPGKTAPSQGRGLSQVEDRISRIRAVLADRGIRVH